MSAAAVSWAIEALVASALLMTAVLLVRAPFRRAFGPQAAYALWSLPMLRLLLPPLPGGWSRAAMTPVSRAGDTLTVLVIDPGMAPGAAMPSAGVLLAGAWAAGACAFLLWHMVAYRIARGRMLLGARAVGEHDGIRIVASAAVPGPIAFGVLRRFVAFPADFAERYDADERELALAHEIGHHQRGDLAANWAALGMLAAHWWNPIAWRAFHAFRADQELANDARVLAGRAPAERHAYARAIVKAAHGRAVAAACHLHTVRDLKGRLKMLTTSRASRRRLAVGTASVALLLIAGLGFTASGTSAAAAINDGVAASTGVDLQLPAPPVERSRETRAAPTRTSRHASRVVVVQDGRTTTYEGADADAYLAAHPVPVPPAPPVPGAPRVQVFARAPDGRATRFTVPETPEIVGTSCSGGDEGEMVRDQTKAGKRRMVICTNRVERVARDAERSAVDGEAIAREATDNARASLRDARRAIETERNLTPDQRQQALAGIADAEAELDAPQ